MAGEISDEKYEFIIWWKIENYRYCWQKRRERFSSPIFAATTIENTKWHLILYPTGVDDEKWIGFYLNREEVDEGPESVAINYVLEFLKNDGSVLIQRSFTNKAYKKTWLWESKICGKDKSAPVGKRSFPSS
ncbi:MATH domain-containing protein [Trichonephila clavipes]|nr:MATH domain-containing protein [Trichonephila clavipes]